MSAATFPGAPGLATAASAKNNLPPSPSAALAGKNACLYDDRSCTLPSPVFDIGALQDASVKKSKKNVASGKLKHPKSQKM